ncbi:MAG TPA: ATP-binding protein, partial [Pirellulales bacterium]
PVVPEVLRTKVTVFLDLYKKTRQIERQAERLRQRAEQLHKLTEASLAIHSALSMDKMLEIIANTAREIIDAHRATMVTTWDENWQRCHKTVSLSPEYESRRHTLQPANGSELYALWIALDRARRLSADQLAAHPAWQTLGKSLWDAPQAPPDWLAAPLTGRDGRTIGLIHLCRKRSGDFTADDEAVVLQLAQMASIAIENILNSEAREANRIKDEFLATLSHELRTPLTAMLGWTQLLRTGQLSADESAHGLEIVERNVMAQAKLIDDLLDVSRIITGKLRLTIRPLSLESVIEAALDVVRPSASAKGVRLEPVFDVDTVQMTGDPDRLQQVVWNLLVNAIKFTPNGGNVCIRLRCGGSHAEIDVTDTGEGINPEFLPHIFDRFRQADSSSRRTHGGLGLGLAIVRHVVELHGGQVSAASDGTGHGATFVVRLPVAAVATDGQSNRAEPTAARVPAASSPPTDLTGLRVLVVDDEPDGREMIGKVLRLYGAEVDVASTVREALALFDQSPPHVLVSDIGMPGQDGYDLIRLVRQLPAARGGRVPALALTAFAREEDRLRALSSGFQLHISKPFEPAELASGVSHLAAGVVPAHDSAPGNGASRPQAAYT